MSKIKNLTKTNVKHGSVKVILLGVAILILMNLLGRWDFLDTTPYQSNVITIIGSLFLLTEVAIFAVIRKVRKGKVNVLDTMIGIVGLIAIVGATLGMFGVTLGFLQSMQSLVDLGVLIFVFVEIFRKN